MSSHGVCIAIDTRSSDGGERPIGVGRSGGGSVTIGDRQKRAWVQSVRGAQAVGVARYRRSYARFVSQVSPFTTSLSPARLCDVEQNNSRAKKNIGTKNHPAHEGRRKEEGTPRRQLRSAWRAVDFRAIPSREVHRCDAINKATRGGADAP